MTNQEKHIQETLKKIGNRFRQVRKAKGYSNYEFFAYDNNISRSQYNRYENGGDFHMSSLLKILLAHNMTLQEFFAEGFDNNSKEKDSGGK